MKIDRRNRFNSINIEKYLKYLKVTKQRLNFIKRNFKIIDLFFKVYQCFIIIFFFYIIFLKIKKFFIFKNIKEIQSLSDINFENNQSYKTLNSKELQQFDTLSLSSFYSYDSYTNNNIPSFAQAEKITKDYIIKILNGDDDLSSEFPNRIDEILIKNAMESLNKNFFRLIFHSNNNIINKLDAYLFYRKVFIFFFLLFTVFFILWKMFILYIKKKHCYYSKYFVESDRSVKNIFFYNYSKSLQINYNNYKNYIFDYNKNSFDETDTFIKRIYYNEIKFLCYGYNLELEEKLELLENLFRIEESLTLIFMDIYNLNLLTKFKSMNISIIFNILYLIGIIFFIFYDDFFFINDYISGKIVELKPRKNFINCLHKQYTKLSLDISFENYYMNINSLILNLYQFIKSLKGSKNIPINIIKDKKNTIEFEELLNSIDRFIKNNPTIKFVSPRDLYNFIINDLKLSYVEIDYKNLDSDVINFVKDHIIFKILAVRNGTNKYISIAKSFEALNEKLKKEKCHIFVQENFFKAKMNTWFQNIFIFIILIVLTAFLISIYNWKFKKQQIGYEQKYNKIFFLLEILLIIFLLFFVYKALSEQIYGFFINNGFSRFVVTGVILLTNLLFFKIFFDVISHIFRDKNINNILFFSNLIFHHKRGLYFLTSIKREKPKQIAKYKGLFKKVILAMANVNQKFFDSKVFSYLRKKFFVMFKEELTLQSILKRFDYLMRSIWNKLIFFLLSIAFLKMFSDNFIDGGSIIINRIDIFIFEISQIFFIFISNLFKIFNLPETLISEAIETNRHIYDNRLIFDVFLFFINIYIINKIIKILKYILFLLSEKKIEFLLNKLKRFLSLPSLEVIRSTYIIILNGINFIIYIFYLRLFLLYFFFVYLRYNAISFHLYKLLELFENFSFSMAKQILEEIYIFNLVIRNTPNAFLIDKTNSYESIIFPYTKQLSLDKCLYFNNKINFEKKLENIFNTCAFSSIRKSIILKTCLKFIFIFQFFLNLFFLFFLFWCICRFEFS